MSLDEDPALVLPLEPAQDLDEGALAGPVVADQAEDFAPVEVHVDPSQRHYGTEALGYAFGAKDHIRLSGAGWACARDVGGSGSAGAVGHVG